MEMRPKDYLEEITECFHLEKKIDEQVLYRTKILLHLYRHVVWNVEHELYELEASANDFGSRRIQDLIDYLSFEFEGEIDKVKTEARLNNIADTQALIIVIDKALCRLKNYPNLGELYFNLINRKYVIKYQYTDAELMEKMDIEKTTYYKRKKEAINCLGKILWAYVLPEIRSQHQKLPLLCADSPR